MKHSSQYRVIGALQRQETWFSTRFIHNQLYEQDRDQVVTGSGYLDLSHLLLLLPVPDRQDVIIGIIHSAEEGAAVLIEKQRVGPSSSKKTRIYKLTKL